MVRLPMPHPLYAPRRLYRTFHPGDEVSPPPSYDDNGLVDLGWPLMKRYPKIKTVPIETKLSMNIWVAAFRIIRVTCHGYQVIAAYHKY